MHYSRVYIDAMGYELPPNVVSSDDIEARLEPLYEALRFQKGQLEALTGIQERRFWNPGFRMCDGAALAGEKAIQASAVHPETIGMLIYGGVCRDHLEPATACAVAHRLSISGDAQVYDVSNACLGVLNGMVHIANAIELGQISAGLVVSCESAREIIDQTISRLLREKNMAVFKKTVATLTGGSGAVAILLTDRPLSPTSHRLKGGAIRNAVAHHRLCVWGPDTGFPPSGHHEMATDSVGVLQNGVALGVDTYQELLAEMGWPPGSPDKVICHQVGATHQRSILDAIDIPESRDFTTFRYLGNIGTVSLPITAAIADERGFLQQGDRVGFFGIGSGLNCLLLAIEW